MKKIFYLLIALWMTSGSFAQKATDNFVGIDETKKVVLKGVKFDGKEWKATINNPKKDMTASGEILLEGNK